MPDVRTLRIPHHHKFHAEVTPLNGVDHDLFEARCVEIPTLSEYANSADEALDLLRDSLITTAKYRSI